MTKTIKILLIAFLCFSCSKDKAVLLPEIESANITMVHDVSPAYIFYNEKSPDSIELNRNNLIITTNWLVNIDKRLRLEQVIPKIQFLQNKKRNAKMHKNEAAKNYFTCNNLSENNLGFIDFTNIYYKTEALELPKNTYLINIESLNKIEISTSESSTKTTSKDNLISDLKMMKDNSKQTTILLHFNKNLTFQEYISLKSELSKIESPTLVISNNEYIY